MGCFNNFTYLDMHAAAAAFVFGFTFEKCSHFLSITVVVLIIRTYRTCGNENRCTTLSTFNSRKCLFEKCVLTSNSEQWCWVYIEWLSINIRFIPRTKSPTFPLYRGWSIYNVKCIKRASNVCLNAIHSFSMFSLFIAFMNAFLLTTR